MLSESSRPMLKSIAFICTKINDGMTEEEIFNYAESGDVLSREFISFCIGFSVENKWLVRKKQNDNYSLTSLGRDFVSTQFPSFQEECRSVACQSSL
jgi:hypothetical protein